MCIQAGPQGPRVDDPARLRAQYSTHSPLDREIAVGVFCQKPRMRVLVYTYRCYEC